MTPVILFILVLSLAVLSYFNMKSFYKAGNNIQGTISLIITVLASSTVVDALFYLAINGRL